MKAITFRRVLAGWTALAVVGWVVLGILAESDAADGRAEGDLVGLCGEEGEWFFFMALPVGVIWLVGAALALVVVCVVVRR